MDIINLSNSALVVQDFFILVKLFVLLGLFLYILFAIVVMRQVKMMISSLKGFLESGLLLIAWLHILASIVIWFFAAVLL